MSVFAVTAEGDLDFTTRNLVLVTEVEDVCIITLEKELSLFKGSWFIDLAQGIPWLQQILGQKPNDLGAIASIFRKRILAFPQAVSAEVECVYDGTTRGLTVPFSVKLDNGSIVDGQVTQ